MAKQFDLNRLRNPFESDREWNMRLTFLRIHKDKFPVYRLLCLSNCYINSEVYGCAYGPTLMNQLAHLKRELPENTSSSRRKGVEKVTFVKQSSLEIEREVLDNETNAEHIEMEVDKKLDSKSVRKDETNEVKPDQKNRKLDSKSVRKDETNEVKPDQNIISRKRSAEKVQDTQSKALILEQKSTKNNAGVVVQRIVGVKKSPSPVKKSPLETETVEKQETTDMHIKSFKLSPAKKVQHQVGVKSTKIVSTLKENVSDQSTLNSPQSQTGSTVSLSPAQSTSNITSKSSVSSEAYTSPASPTFDKSHIKTASLSSNKSQVDRTNSKYQDNKAHVDKANSKSKDIDVGKSSNIPCSKPSDLIVDKTKSIQTKPKSPIRDRPNLFSALSNESKPAMGTISSTNTSAKSMTEINQVVTSTADTNKLSKPSNATVSKSETEKANYSNPAVSQSKLTAETNKSAGSTQANIALKTETTKPTVKEMKSSAVDADSIKQKENPSVISQTPKSVSHSSLSSEWRSPSVTTSATKLNPTQAFKSPAKDTAAQCTAENLKPANNTNNSTPNTGTSTTGNGGIKSQGKPQGQLGALNTEQQRVKLAKQYNPDVTNSKFADFMMPIDHKFFNLAEKYYTMKTKTPSLASTALLPLVGTKCKMFFQYIMGENPAPKGLHCFTCSLFCENVEMGYGEGPSKKKAKHSSVEAAGDKLMCRYLKVSRNSEGKQVLEASNEMFPCAWTLHEADNQAEEPPVDSQHPSFQPESNISQINQSKKPRYSQIHTNLSAFLIIHYAVDPETSNSKGVLNNSANFNNALLEYSYQQRNNGVECVVRLENEKLSEHLASNKADAKSGAADEALSTLKMHCWTIRMKQAVDNDEQGVSRDAVMQELHKESGIPENNKGSEMLKKMGWTGGGLGAEGNKGMELPVAVTMETVTTREGLGMNAVGDFKDFSKKIVSKLEEYAQSSTGDDLAFSSEFNDTERKFIHQTCYRLGLKTVSRGSGVNRYLTVSRKRSANQLFDHIIAKGGETSKYVLIPPET